MNHSTKALIAVFTGLFSGLAWSHNVETPVIAVLAYTVMIIALNTDDLIK